MVDKEQYFTWLNRYSDTDEADKFSRWARICYVGKDLDVDLRQIGWVSRLHSEIHGHHSDKYQVRGMFPISASDESTYRELFNTFEEAKKALEDKFIEFKKIIIQLELNENAK